MLTNSIWCWNNWTCRQLFCMESSRDCIHATTSWIYGRSIKVVSIVEKPIWLETDSKTMVQNSMTSLNAIEFQRSSYDMSMFRK